MRAPLLVLLVCAAVGAVLFGATPAGAQSTQGDLLGQVTDSLTGLGVKTAHIECVNTETRQAYSATAGLFGLYSFSSLSPGRYAVTVSENSYQAQQALAVEVTVASRVELNFRLDRKRVDRG